MIKSNFHTHTVFSDGHDSPREMTEAALSHGFYAIGFSDHSYEAADESYCMTKDGEREYFKTVKELSCEHKDKINVFCGVEFDCESKELLCDYDFVISSVHELIVGNKIYSVDTSPDIQREMIRDGYGGSVCDMAKAYFERVTEHIINNRTDIVGHFDLITKYGLMPESDETYIRAATESVREILKHCKVFELNTGAIARGLRNVPYPASFILNEIKTGEGRIIVNSDCHYKEKLTFWFDKAEDFLSSHGFVKNANGKLNDRINNIEIWE